MEKGNGDVVGLGKLVVAWRGYDGAVSDMWSYGVILLVLLTSYLPFDDSNLMAMYKKIN